MKKKTLPTDWYSCSCRGVQRADQNIQVVWTVDTGPYSWQNVIQYSGSDQASWDKIVHVFAQLGITLGGPDDVLTDITVPGVRGMLHVSQIVDDTDPNFVIKRNIILEAKPPIGPAEFNIFAASNDLHVLRGTQHGGAKLPIAPKRIDS